jgi:peptidoglycan/LPS O-acetylase OafA/YrhL|tara:strand:- start:11527 stop:13401 length:1875 start_codon:yes stop_codon:yes gene_type:complete
MKYRAEIDGLRALAVLPVILFHAGFESFSGGFVGVDVFFVISGYLITTIIISEMAKGNFSIVNFYERRARRILPAMFFVIAVSLPFAWFWLGPSDLKDFGQSLVAVSTFSSNILFWRESGYFDTVAELKPLLHTWSLAVEEQYYVIFPIFLMLTWRLGVQWVVTLLAIIFLLSLSLAQWGAYNNPFAAFFLLPTRGWELLVGVFAAFYLKYNTHLKSQPLNQFLSLLGFSMIAYSIIVFNKTTPFPGLHALIPTLGTGLLILCAVPKTFIHSLLSMKSIVGIGLISYSAYLWHQPLLAFARHRLLGEVPDLLLIVLCITSLVMAWFSWHFVEKPFRHKLILKRKFIFAFSSLGISFLLLTGLWLNATDGGLVYYSPEKQKALSNFINANDYTERQHREITLKKFNKTDNKKDILIIGDSHSQDLANMVFEAELNNIYEFSAFYISNSCGVLMIDRENLKIRPTVHCNKETLFLNNALVNQMLAADEIWVVARWRNDDLNYMKESLENILSVNTNLMVFGTKYLGSVNSKWYIDNDLSLWKKSFLHEGDRDIFRETAMINDSLLEITKLLGVKFINTQGLVCNSNDFCSNYVDGNIISYDGSHLTPYGARVLGSQLKALVLKQAN